MNTRYLHHLIFFFCIFYLQNLNLKSASDFFLFFNLNFNTYLGIDRYVSTKNQVRIKGCNYF
jgi:hypothetical protein